MGSLISTLAQHSYPLRKRLIELFKSGVVVSKTKNAMPATKSIYDFKIQGIEGNEINFSDFKGKKLLFVNTASECGYTPQYASLQQLHERYPDKLIVIGFPSNNFGAQEPGNELQILNFCKENYSVTFPLTKKIDVIGDHQHEIFQWLTKKELNGWNDREPNWNFCKYLVDENGNLIHFFSHKMDPLDPQIITKVEA